MSATGRTLLRLAGYAHRLLTLAETVHRWLGALASLDDTRRRRVARYARRIAATLARAGSALHRFESVPGDVRARERAIRELGRIAGYIETMVDALDRHLDGRKLAGVKRRLEQLGSDELHKCVRLGQKPSDIDRLALADGLQT